MVGTDRKLPEPAPLAVSPSAVAPDTAHGNGARNESEGPGLRQDRVGRSTLMLRAYRGGPSPREDR